jgi:hypothetical protein
MANKQTPLPKKLASVPPAPPAAEPLPPPELSPEAKKLSDEAAIWHEIFSIMGNATIKANQCLMAKAVLDRVQVEVTRSEIELQKQLDAEEAAKSAASIPEAVMKAAEPRPTAS